MANSLKTIDDNVDVQDKIKRIVEENDLVLFMKGTPNMPSCGFSQRAAIVLGNYETPLFHVNVLDNSAIRQGVKVFSNWPTIPQIYIKGKFIGGSDIIQEMHDCGELAKLLN